MDKISFFSADYRDGRVHIGGKVYQAGYFATHLLNQYYENDTAMRISVFTLDKTTVLPFFEGFETMRNHSVFSLPLHNIASVSYKNASEFCLLSKNEQLEWEITIPSKQPIKENTSDCYPEYFADRLFINLQGPHLPFYPL